MIDPTPNDLSHLSDEEFNALAPQGYHATGPAEPLGTRTDFRALCAELLDVIDSLPCETNYRNESRCVFPIDEDVVFRARAALAQPEPQGPSDKELLELMPQSIRDEFDHAAWVCSDATGRRVKPGIFRAALNNVALEYARAVLDRWGGSAPCPYVVSSDEGTSYCRLAEHTADQLAKPLGESGG